MWGFMYIGEGMLQCAICVDGLFDVRIPRYEHLYHTYGFPLKILLVREHVR